MSLARVLTTSAPCCLLTISLTKKGDRIGDRKIKAITPVAADKIYDRIIDGLAGRGCGKAKR